jgi:hypothetical protein
MKRILALTTALVIALGALALAGSKPVTYKANVWRAVQVYDLAALSKELDAHTRQLVGAKCSLRGKDIRHMKPNWYEGSIWQPIPGQSGKFSHVPVMIAKADLEAFKSIPTDTSGSEVTLYGIVEYDIKPNFRYLRLVGRNATTDAAGNATVTW